jgi:hypothetical protein
VGADFELRWGWRVRLAAIGMACALAACAVWAWRDPETTLAGAVVATGFAVAGLVVAAALLVDRVRVDDRGLERRTLFRTRDLPWSAIDAALLVRTYQRGATIIHERVLDFDVAEHVILRCEGRRSWSLNAWMDGFEALLAEVARRQLPRALVAVPMPRGGQEAAALGLAPLPTRGGEAAAAGLRALDQFNAAGAVVLSAFALLFVLLVGAFALIFGLGVVITGSWIVDLGLVCVALLAALWGASRVLGRIGAARFGDADAVPGGVSRVDWMLSGAGLLGGILLLVGFIPRVFAGGENLWVDLVIAALAAFLVYSAITSWLRGS